MLVDNKFLYISLPRCASTSFMATCVKNEINIEHYHNYLNVDNQLSVLKKELYEIDYDNFGMEINHGHEPINVLCERFGNKYDIISVKRNKYERFVSLWKHIIHNTQCVEHNDTLKTFKEYSAKDILFYKDYDLLDDVSVKEIIEIFKNKSDLKNLTPYGENMLTSLIRPYSYWHSHNPNIIWFDFDKLYELEEWVSNKLGKEFKLLDINSSKKIESNLILDDEFRELYDTIYYKYDETKSKKTLI
jgi:hypothetical protein